MARFNTTSVNEQNPYSNHPQKTKNYEGGMAFTLPPEIELYQRVVSCLYGEPRFYESGQDQAEAIIELVRLVCEQDMNGVTYVVNLAEYARTVLHLRTVSIVLLVEASRYQAKHPNGWVKNATPRIIQRADELMECIAYWNSRHGHIGDMSEKGSLPASLKKGLAYAIKKFDEYQLAKYNRNNSKVKLIDVLRIVHPKPKDPVSKILFKKIKEDRLITPETWETHISKYGSTKENWEYILDKMPIMALIRNLRNLIQNDIDYDLLQTHVIGKLTDPTTIMNSKQFPFRFLAAYREIEKAFIGQTTYNEIESVSGNQRRKAEAILKALDQAMNISIMNLPKLKGKTAIFADNSGSMDTRLSDKSKMSLHDIANTMLCIADRMTDHQAILGTFASHLKILTHDGEKETSILADANEIKKIQVGGSTDTWKCLHYLITNKIHVDRILIFTDQQSYDSSDFKTERKPYYFYDNRYEIQSFQERSIAHLFRKYKQEVNPNCYLYNIDLSGYGTTQVPVEEPNTCLIGGWSERILEYISAFEQKEDKVKIIERIKNHTW